MAKEADAGTLRRMRSVVSRMGEIPYDGTRKSLAPLRDEPEIRRTDSPRLMRCAVEMGLRQGEFVRNGERTIRCS